MQNFNVAVVECSYSKVAILKTVYLTYLLHGAESFLRS